MSNQGKNQPKSVRQQMDILCHAITTGIQKGRVDELRHLGVLPEFSDMADLVESIARSIEQRQSSMNNQNEHSAHERAFDEAILESIGEGIIMTDRDGVITMVNNAAAVILRCNRQDYLGRKWFDAVRSVNEKGQPKALQDRAIFISLQARRKTHSNHYYLRTDGSTVPVSVTAAPIIFEGQLVGAISVIRDITQEKEIERAKNEFVALASHQLRTPQTAIKWYSEMLLAEDLGPLADVQRQFLQEIYDGNQRMVEMVNALLNVSKIELGQLGNEPEQLDLARIIDETISELALLIGRGELEVAKEIETEDATIHADPRLLKMVLQNLLSNAIKYTPPKGTITVGLRRHNNALMLYVQDSGYGIPSDQQEKIFTKFFRAENVKTRDTDGSGLGLYINKAIVEQCGGRIWFKSSENKGTTFYVTLPLTQRSSQVLLKQKSSPVKEGAYQFTH